MDILKPHDIYEWRVPRSPMQSSVRMLLHCCAIVAVYNLTFPGHHRWIWLFTVTYYWFFYARMIRFALWTSETLGIIHRASASSPTAQLRRLAEPGDWPEFVVLVPAFGAGRCIQTVATILVEQDYPRVRWRGVLVSDDSEDKAAVERSRAAATDIQEGIRAQAPPESLPVSEAALVLYLSDRAPATSLDYVRLFGLPPRKAAEAWADLLTLLVARGIAPGADVPGSARNLLAELMERTARSNAKSAADISAMMGIRRHSVSLAMKEQIWTTPRTPRDLAGALETAVRGGSRDALTGLRARLLSAGGWDRIAAAYSEANPSTSDAIEDILARLDSPHLIHCRRPSGKRNKASALNFGLDQAAKRGWLHRNTHIMVLDSDSFLPTNALALSAMEIVRDPEANVIRQLLPVTSTNFNGRNWFVQTIIAADSMASPGRWAANVRTQTRSDLTAGSGVVIPALFLNYLIETYGEAWDSGIICEDARMIISHYAILDGVTKLTKMVPAFVLEGAPEQKRVWPTYVAFWRQRVRWALGGMDEFVSLMQVPVRRLLVRSYDFTPILAGPWLVLTAELRKLRLLVSWLKEHVWWSGISLAPLLWLAAESFCGVPRRPARVLGYLCLFLVPGLLLQCLFKRHVAPLIPGGVSRWQLLELLFALVCMSVPFILPVVFAQLVCLTGQRGRLAGWNPATPKPGSQFAMGRKSETHQTLLVTDSGKEPSK